MINIVHDLLVTIKIRFSGSVVTSIVKFHPDCFFMYFVYNNYMFLENKSFF